jgi:hypothetical protein
MSHEKIWDFSDFYNLFIFGCSIDIDMGVLISISIELP